MPGNARNAIVLYRLEMNTAAGAARNWDGTGKAKGGAGTITAQEREVKEKMEKWRNTEIIVRIPEERVQDFRLMTVLYGGEIRMERKIKTFEGEWTCV